MTGIMTYRARRTIGIKQLMFYRSIVNIKTSYALKVENGVIEKDSKQQRVVKLLSKLQDNLNDYIPQRCREGKEPHSSSDLLAVNNINDGYQKLTEKPLIPRGAYIWGEVGTGKTMLMDMFYDTVNIPTNKKRRVHFHKFMLEDVHGRIHLYKKELMEKHGRDRHINLASGRDAITHVARAISDEAWLLCFDEFQVTDVADALIMTQLFNELWRQGTVLVATSNRPPVDLYKDGLNRSYFLPFIESLQQWCIVCDITSTEDYRLKNSHLSNSTNSYYTPLNHTNTKRLYDLFLTMAGASSSIAALQIPVMMGRLMDISLAGNGVAWVTYADLCEKERGTADYRALCNNFHTIFMDGIPQMSALRHDAARRFILLVDELYDSGTRLFWTAATDPASLFFNTLSEESSNNGNSTETTLEWNMDSKNPGYDPSVSVRAFEQSEIQRKVTSVTGELDLAIPIGELAAIQELSFAFRRAASRLTEMSKNDSS